MVQVFDLSPTDSSGSLLGRAAAMGIARNYPQPEQVVQRNQLSEALQKIPQNAGLLDVLKTAGPQLMTTPGGAQLLGELAPLLQKTQGNEALRQYLQNEQNKLSVNQPQNMQPQAGVAPSTSQTTTGKPFGQDYFRNPQVPVSPESTYPKMSALPQKRAYPSPEQLQAKRLNLMENYVAQNIPPDPVAIENAIQNEIAAVDRYNANIDREMLQREEKQSKQTADIMNRFEKSSAKPKSDEDKFIFEKFANEAKDAANPNDQYTYAKKKYDQYENARNGIIREADLPGRAEKLWRQAIGNYKSKEAVMKELYPHVKKLIDLGLENEARMLLSENVGLGKEDVELTMFPPSEEDKKMFNSLPVNPRVEEYQKIGKGKDIPAFPSEELALTESEFPQFKQSILDILQKNPETNLVALRGIINQDKKYSWTDYSKALAELIDEGLINPDNYQEQQWNVIKSPPVEGLGGMFKNFWKGTR